MLLQVLLSVTGETDSALRTTNWVIHIWKTKYAFSVNATSMEKHPQILLLMASCMTQQDDKFA